MQNQPLVFFVFRLSISRSYTDLFNPPEEKAETNDRGGTKNPALSWYDTLISLADENPLELSRATRLGVREAFNFLVWKYNQVRRTEQASNARTRKI